MSEKLEYDAQLGGTVVLDDHVPTYRYAAAALQEVRDLVEEVSKQSAGGGKLIFQTLPKHLRRRAMSHNPKRLPRKYRRIHISQMEKSGGQRVKKRPSRKYRRRPKVLMQDYIRRQRRHAWLETHIWHARRFHMVDRWGYRLPHYSCDKMYRACYRAGAEHCLVQDISYYACFELQGTVAQIFVGLCRLSNGAQTAAGGGLTIKANTYLNGQREGALDLFCDNQYPAGALCRATFMWRPLSEQQAAAENNEKTKRTMWLWVHACVYKQLLMEFVKVFELTALESEAMECVAAATDKDEFDDVACMKATKSKVASVRQQLRAEVTAKAAIHTRGQRYKNLANDLTLIDLKDAMNRFRLTGPLSQCVLGRALRAKGLNASQVDATAPDWFQQLATDDAHFQAQHQAQSEFWSKCKSLDSPTNLLPNFVLGLNVIDPRLKRPYKRTKAKAQKPDSPSDNEDPLTFLVDLKKCLSNSAIWDADVRQRVRLNMMDTHTWCQLREKHALVPGKDCAFEEQMQAMPLLLIQRPGLQERNMRLNYGCGWDLIVPAGYGLLVWLTLIMWGAKPGGLRESDTLAREMGRELHLPDTVGGTQMAAEAYVERRAKYFKLPQAKRANYTKLAIASPFRVPWQQLVRDWLTAAPTQQAEIKFFVLRDRAQLTALNAMLRSRREPINEPTSAENAVIQVRLRLSTRGNIDVHALICLPTHIDIKRKLKARRNASNEPIHMEPTPPDLNQKARKLLRKQHKTQLKRLRRQRYREKRKQQETSTSRVTIRAADTAGLVAAQAAKMQALWLPNEACESLYSVRKQCSRECVGYVTTAGFSLSVGTVCAVGYVTANGLKALISMQQKLLLPQPLCLVRDINSPQYYFASFDVPTDP